MKHQFPIALVTALSLSAGAAHAGEAENIAACVNATQTHAGKTVDEFDVVYEGAFLGFSEANWPGVTCQVSLASVWSLSVGGELLVVDGFSGPEAKATYERLSRETKEAIALLQSRQNILVRRLSEAETALQSPAPDVTAVSDRVADGIRKATGR